MTVWSVVRQIIALIIVFFTLALACLYLLGYGSDDWQIAVSEWLAVWSMEIYTFTFYWDLGDEYFIEQIKEYFKWGDRSYQLVQDNDVGRWNTA